jgi:hypothetical protein
MSATDDAVAAHSGTPRPQAGAFSLDRVIVNVVNGRPDLPPSGSDYSVKTPVLSGLRLLRASRPASQMFHCVFSAIVMKLAHFPGNCDPSIGAGRKRAESNMDAKTDDKSAGQCPVMHTSKTNRDWWPHQLDLQVLHRNSALPNPMDANFDYAKEFKSLDLNGRPTLAITAG